MPERSYMIWRLVAVLLLIGCANQPDKNSAIEDMRTVYAAAQRDPDVVRLAPLELNVATEALRRAEAAWTDRAGAEQVGQLAYLAMMRSAIASEVARSRAAENAVASAVQRRSGLQLQARAETARRQAAAASQQQEQLESMQAVRTRRGWVVTLGDILFDNGQASLNPAGVRAIQKLAEFMIRYQARTVAIEGFTDNANSDRYNQDLSESRVDAVRRSLLDAGIGANRIMARSYGKEYPIATNDTVAGRTWNRRVEVVISDENGHIVAR